MVIKKVNKYTMIDSTYQLLGSFLECLQKQHVRYNSEYERYLSKDCSIEMKRYIYSKFHNTYLFVNERTGEILGMGILKKDFNSLHISEIYVCPSQRGRGYAKRFIKKVLSKSDNPVTLRVHTKNNKAVHLYKSFGFEWYGDICPMGSRMMIYKGKSDINA